MLEVFLRRQMGERYFSLTGVLAIALVLWQGPALFHRRGYHEDFWNPFTLWYGFALVFVAVGLYRKWELWRRPQRFDFQHFSLSTGTPWPPLQRVTIQGKTLAFSPYLLTTLIEPATAVLPGWGLGRRSGCLSAVALSIP